MQSPGSDSSDENTSSSSDKKGSERVETKRISSVVFPKRQEINVIDVTAKEKEKVSSVVKIKRHEYKKENKTTGEGGRIEPQYKIKVAATEEISEECINAPGDGCCVDLISEKSSSISTQHKAKDGLTLQKAGRISDPPKKGVIRINRTVFKKGQLMPSSEECTTSKITQRQRRWSGLKDAESTPHDDTTSAHSDKAVDVEQNIINKALQTYDAGERANTVSTLGGQGTSSAMKGKASELSQKQINQLQFSPPASIDQTVTKTSSILFPKRDRLGKKESSHRSRQASKVDQTTCTKEEPVSKRRLKGLSLEKEEEITEKIYISPISDSTESSSSDHRYLEKEKLQSKVIKRRSSMGDFERCEKKKKRDVKDKSVRSFCISESPKSGHKRILSTSSDSDSQPISHKRQVRQEQNRVKIKKIHINKNCHKSDDFFSSDQESPKRPRSRSGSLYSDSYSTERLKHRLVRTSKSAYPRSDSYSTSPKRQNSSRVTPVSASPCDRSKPGWHEDHEKYTSLCKISRSYDVLLVGDSIIKGLARYSNIWKKYLEPLHALNFGIGGDQTQHVLWRLQNGELNCHPKVVVVHCGTNNINKDCAEDIVEGILATVNYIRTKRVDAKVIVVGLLPRDYFPDTFRRVKIEKVNSMLEEQISFSDELQEEPIWFLRPEDDWVDEDGRLNEDLYHTDWLHLVEAGDEKLAKAISNCVRDVLQEGGCN